MSEPDTADRIPLSRNVGMYEARDYWITAAEWRGTYGSSFEIGVRQKAAFDGFTLVQGNWNERTVKRAAQAVALLLDAGFLPSELNEVLNP